MASFKDMSGLSFGRLTVESMAATAKSGHYQWNCRCECGETLIVRGCHLRSGHTESCGCITVERIVRSNVKRTTHGLRGGSNRKKNLTRYLYG